MTNLVFVITARDTVGLVILAILFLAFLFVWGPYIWRQLSCRHNGPIGETTSCDAVCRKCGKNLGFIGAWREKQKGG